MSVHILDTLHLGRPGIVAATALETSDGVVLFDTGPESTFEHVRAGLEAIGCSVGDVRHVFVSHIHFDHAGAAWRFARSSVSGKGKGATIYVHERGAPHLIDPSKLVQSATRIFGDDMQRLWGTIAPVESDRVRVVADGEIIAIPPYQIRAMATPGHANHHHVYLWDDNLFGGDVAGVRIGAGPPIPPFVPPELQVESWIQSLEKIRAADPANLYLPHFGRFAGSVSAHLDAMEDRVKRWSEWFRNKLRGGVGEEQLKSEFAMLEHAELRESGATDAGVMDYEAADPSFMAVPAAQRYWHKFHPDKLGLP